MVRFSNFQNASADASTLRILALLEENSRTPFVEIAKDLKVSETAVRKRVKKLEKEGVILKYTIDVDLKKIGLKTRALIGVDVTPEAFLTVIEKIKKMPEATRVYSSTGDHMILTESRFKNSHELAKFEKKLKSVGGVTRICPTIILERIK